MPITDWPQAERPREKLLARGPEVLSDAELLAIFLRTGVAGKTAVDVARELLAQFGGLRPLLGRTRGVVRPRLEMRNMRAHGGARNGAAAPRRSADAWCGARARVTPRVSKACLRDQAHEVFCGLFLDNRHRVIAFEELFTGTLNGTAVYPREVVKHALRHNAAAVIFAHNHPSGVAEPSRADEVLTARLKEALALVDIRVLDHVVVGDGDMVSFSERGLL
jgi:DNA repair protein RadC